MDKKTLEKANNIAKKIEKYENELSYWQRSIGYHKSTFEVDLGQSIVPLYHFIPFEEMKERAIEYYRAKIAELEKELDNL